MAMKLVIAIVHSDDASDVLGEISRAGFGATKLSTTGGFMRAGNTTLLIGVDEEKTDEVIALIGKRAKTHKQLTQVPQFGNEHNPLTMPIEVTVGGATIFVVDVDKYVRL